MTCNTVFSGLGFLKNNAQFFSLSRFSYITLLDSYLVSQLGKNYKTLAKSLLSTCLCTMLFCYYGNTQDWETHQLTNGMSMPCHIDQAQYDNSLDNYLRVIGSMHSDLYLKLVKKSSDEVVREVYIKKNTSYNIRNIPQEKYYVKIAYGKEPQADGNCQFRFGEEIGYEQPSHIFDYFNRLASRGLVIPCYELNLRRDEDAEKRYAQSTSADIGFD